MRVTESMGPAWERMKSLLFRPFAIGTWFSFGLAFFLQSCIEGDGGSNFNLPSGGGSGGGGSHRGESDDDIGGLLHDLGGRLGSSLGGAGGRPDPLAALERLDSAMLVAILVGAVAVAIPIVLLMTWLGTRGQMMAIRGVASGRADISENWSGTREAGGALFKLHLALMGLGLVTLGPVVGIGAAVVGMPILRDHADYHAMVVPILVLAVVALLVMIPFLLVRAMTRNFVAPIMLKHGIGARDAWMRFWAVGRAHVGSIFVFFILRAVVGLGAAIVGTVAGFLTCCIGFLPFLHDTLMAPYHVFERAWTLEVLASMSPDFDLRQAPPPPAGPAGGPPGGYPGGPSSNPYGGGAGDNPYLGPGYGPPPAGGFGGPGAT